jgi:predicted secreted hydrolase
MSDRRPRAMAVVLTLAVGAAVLAVTLLLRGGDTTAPGRGIEATIAVADALAGDTTGFARALTPRPFSFPDDHGPHPDFRTEWWYYTGNLEAADGRHFGFQLTFFRNALAPPAAGRDGDSRDSAWATRQVFLAHFALTDTTGGRFHAARRLVRQALGLAGAQAAPFHVWVEDWSVEGEPPEGLPMRLRAADGDVAIDLSVSADKPPVRQGDRGLSRKGPEPGNASYYYSFTRMTARGTVRLDGEALAVSGHAWMDREWSTSALGPELAGWDWFALQLDDERDLMFYVLRRHDGTADPFSAGVLVAADGGTRALDVTDVAIEALQHWTSPRSAVRYPARWRLTIPSAAMRLEVTPRLADQELLVGPRYWEGAVAVQGTAEGRPVSGMGYVELVGYGE